MNTNPTPLDPSRIDRHALPFALRARPGAVRTTVAVAAVAVVAFVAFSAIDRSATFAGRSAAEDQATSATLTLETRAPESYLAP